MYQCIRSNLNILNLLGPQKIPRYLKIWNIDGKILHEKVFEMFLTSNSLWHIHGTLISEISFTCMLKKLKFNCSCILLHTLGMFENEKRFCFTFTPIAIWRIKAFLFIYTLKLICIFIHFEFMYFWYRWLSEISVCIM